MKNDINNIVDLFEKQAVETPQSTAVLLATDHKTSAIGEFTYKTLSDRTNQLANYLGKSGVRPGDLVGICATRSLEMVVGILAILKTGSAYVPLDPGYPKERLEFMLKDSQVKIVLTQDKFTEFLPIKKTELININQQAIFKESKEIRASKYRNENLAYVIYTSGSTGKPKGVMVSQKNLIHSISARLEYYHEPVKRFLLLSPFSFDSSVAGIFPTLVQGGTLCLPKQGIERDPEQLRRLIEKYKITHTLCLPSLYALLLQHGTDELKSLETVIVAGEECPRTLVDSHFERLPITSLFNEYGPTEATVWATAFKMTANMKHKKVPIGQPIQDTQIVLLDEEQKPVSNGEPGEIYIEGPGVTRGYLNQPQLTSQKFLANPFDGKTNQRIYKTGDLARHLPDGNLEFLGRKDNQIKIRGYRIELGEIESALRQNPFVQEAVVIVQKPESRDSTTADNKLVAYVVPNGLLEESNNNEWKSSYFSEFQMLYDDLYNQEEAYSKSNPLINKRVWTSSYTNKPLEEEEILECVSDTVKRIVALKPSSILEIGCGTGLLLSKVAPHCRYYFGTDISEKVLNRLQSHLQEQNFSGTQIELQQRFAHDFKGMESDFFDAVIINEVVQHFPDIEYLMQVIEKATRVVKQGGFIFLGGLRNLALLKTFHTSVQFHRNGSSLSVAELQQRIEQQLSSEKDLVIDPKLFSALQQRISEIGSVQIELKGGHFHNEITKFKYDAILYVGSTNENSEENCGTDFKVYNWSEQELSISTLRKILARKPKTLAIRNVPNKRLSRDLKIQQLIETAGADEMAANLDQPSEHPGIEPTEFWQLGDKLSYTINIRWSDDDIRLFDVLFSHQSRDSLCLTKDIGSYGEAVDWYNYTNKPVKGSFDSKKIAPELRRHLEKKLPDYMIPARFILLESLPLTPNGKIDRKALPALDKKRPDLDQNYVPPHSELECFLAKLWSEVLEIEGVGIHDRFFELGGNSLQAARFVNQLQTEIEEPIFIVTIFDASTISEYAVFLKKNYPDAIAKRFPSEKLNGKHRMHENEISESKINKEMMLRMQKCIPRLIPNSETLEDKNSSAIFILAPPRSGTTLLRVMLAGHPRLFAAAELQLLGFNTLQERRDAFQGKFSFWLEGAVRTVMDIKRCDAEQAKQIIENYERQGYTTMQFYSLLQEWIGKKILVDKSPSYALDPNALNKAEKDFNNPLYVHLVRHPYSTINSFVRVRMEQVLFLKEHSFSAKQLGELVWLVSHKNIVDFLNKIPAARQVRLNYENLVKEPKAMMEQLCSHFNWDFHPGILQPYQNIERKMVDGIYKDSEPMGDTNFLQHQKIEAKLAESWQEVHQDNFLSEQTWDLAKRLGFANPDSSKKKQDNTHFARRRRNLLDQRRNAF